MTAEGWYIDEVEFFGTDVPWQGIDDLIPLILHPAVEQSRPNPRGPRKLRNPLSWSAKTLFDAGME